MDNTREVQEIDLRDRVGIAPEVNKITRARFLELSVIAGKVVDFLEAEGIKRHEGCQIRQMVEQMWYMEK